MNRIAVTGATGFIGTKLVAELVKMNYTVHAIARNEGKLVELAERFKGHVKIFPCDIDDYCTTLKAVKGCGGIYHLASSKIVDLSEQNSLRTIQTNIIGTNNLLRLTIENKELKFIVTTSTDKAARISGTYAATKYLAEKLFSEYEAMNSEHCKYRVVRLGNVFYSTSSVLEKWKKKIEAGEPIYISNPEASRYFMKVDKVISLLLSSIDQYNCSEPIIPEMKAVDLKVLLGLMIKKYAGSRKIEVSTTGLQRGESMHEYLTNDMSSEFAERWSQEELYDLL